jgi:hypothetical protein
VFLCNFLSPKRPYEDGNVVRSSKSQNHRKCPKIIENHVFWTVCELLAYYEVIGMLLVHFWTDMDLFMMFWSVFCVFRPLFESRMSFWGPKTCKMALLRGTLCAKNPKKSDQIFFFQKCPKCVPICFLDVFEVFLRIFEIFFLHPTYYLPIFRRALAFPTSIKFRVFGVP